MTRDNTRVASISRDAVNCSRNGWARRARGGGESASMRGTSRKLREGNAARDDETTRRPSPLPCLVSLSLPVSHTRVIILLYEPRIRVLSGTIVARILKATTGVQHNSIIVATVADLPHHRQLPSDRLSRCKKHRWIHSQLLAPASFAASILIYRY